MGRHPLITPKSSSPSKSTQIPVQDVQKDREASRLRLLDVWAGLAERYSRHMDDDDLVDIRTGEIIKDNGVLRNAPTLQFGTLAAPVTAPVDEINQVDEEEDVYDLDELDCFAKPTIDADEHPKSGVAVPPATPIDRANADDLREFLEAEKIRKVQCGTDVDEESEERQSIREDSSCWDSSDDEEQKDGLKLIEGKEPHSLKRKRDPYSPSPPSNHVPFTPVPDPRAQLIIAQAVQQLSALVTGVWQPPAPHYLEGSSPRTPQRRTMSIQPSSSRHTPTHPYMYPYLYDPAFSGASLPPGSPEPERHRTTSRKSLVSRSHSRVRKVSFQSIEESDTPSDGI